MLTRVIDFLKSRQITALFTSLTPGGETPEATQAGISSLIDTWILLRDVELGGERNRGLYVLKARGMAHSNQVREFVLTDHGIELEDVYIGPEGVLTGSMRQAQQARERAADLARRQERKRRQRELELKRRALDAQIAAQRAQFEAEQDETRQLDAHEQIASDRLREGREKLASTRQAGISGARRRRSRDKGTAGGRR
jgi:circadian clock protein KaiC